LGWNDIGKQDRAIADAKDRLGCIGDQRTPGNDAAANNLSGFTAIPAGVRYFIFMARANYSTWWTASTLTQTIARAVMLARNSEDLDLNSPIP
jgi:hypothetical protein